MPENYGLLAFFGWEAGDLLEAHATSGGVSASTTQVKTGTYSLRIAGTGANQNWVRLSGTNTYTGTSDVAFGVDSVGTTGHFYLDTLPSSGEEEIMRLIDTSSVKMATVRVTSGGALKLLDSTDTVIGTSSAITTGAWHRLEWLVRYDDVVVLRVDGTDQIAGTGTFHGSDVYSSMYLGNFASAGTTAFTVYFDDMVFTVETLLGEAHVKALIPNGAGTAGASWTGDYTAVDEIPPDGATTIISSTANGNIESVALQNSTTAGLPATATIVGYKYGVNVRRFGVGTPLMVFYSITDGSDDLKPDDTGFTPAATFSCRWKTSETHQGHPVSEIDDLEVVVADVRTSGINAMQCTQMLAQVLYLERVATIAFETPHAGI